MPLGLRQGLLASTINIAFLLVSLIFSHAGSINYQYDDLNRLIRIYYSDGKVVEYTYDNSGNRIGETIYQITDVTPPTTTASPAGGFYNSTQSITLSCNDGSGSGCSKIYFTTDGSTPTPSSKIYSFPVNVSTTTTLKFFARDMVGNSESPKTEIYTIDTVPPTLTASPTGGTYNSAQSVALTCNDVGGSGCDKIYYTTDGTTPTPSSQIYSNPLNIPVTSTLSFFAKDLAGNSETVKSQTYTISTSLVIVRLKDSLGNPLSGGVIQYYSGGWKTFGTTDANGQASKELQPGPYSFSMTYGFARQEKSQNTVSNPTLVFQTKSVSIQLKDSIGALMDTGTVQYYSGGWRDIGSTSGGQISKELLPGTYSFSMTYTFGRQEKSQNITNDPAVIFITGKVHSDSGSSTNYYAGGWRLFVQDMELLPGAYTFRFNDGTPEQSYTIIAGIMNSLH